MRRGTADEADRQAVIELGRMNHRANVACTQRRQVNPLVPLHRHQCTGFDSPVQSVDCHPGVGKPNFSEVGGNFAAFCRLEVGLIEIRKPEPRTVTSFPFQPAFRLRDTLHKFVCGNVRQSPMIPGVIGDYMTCSCIRFDVSSTIALSRFRDETRYRKKRGLLDTFGA